MDPKIYIYRISTGWHTNIAVTIDAQFSIGTDDTIGGTVTLDTGTTSDASNNKWTNHPAFTFGTTELTGIWVAKFEASGIIPAISFIPNVTSTHGKSISDFFTATRNMETNTRYGWGTSGTDIDTHMMKNIEWGAVAYLSKSTYGKTTEIWKNISEINNTGCAGIAASTEYIAACQNTYDTLNGQQASTTGNIYGVYDMSGGVFEFVSAYVNVNNGSLNTYGASIVSAADKYKDIYTFISITDNITVYYNNASNKKGDAIYETSSLPSSSYSWFSSQSSMATSSNQWFARGGYCQDTTTLAGIFSFKNDNASSDTRIGFRSVVLVGAGL